MWGEKCDDLSINISVSNLCVTNRKSDFSLENEFAHCSGIIFGWIMTFTQLLNWARYQIERNRIIKQLTLTQISDF